MESLVTPAPRPFFNFVPEHDVQFWSTLAAQAQSANGSLAKNR
jgi:hypothetical protein